MKTIKPKFVSFIGLPASGKGTQAELFAKKYNGRPIGIGNLVRERIDEIKKSKAQDQESREILESYNNGKPVSDFIAMELLKKKLEKNNKELIIFDNFPFSRGQFELLQNYTNEKGTDMPLVIYIKISPEEALKRITTRKICSKCGAPYMADATVCEKCGGKLIVRTDDNPQVMKNRIAVYVPSIQEITTIYQNKMLSLIEVNGLQTIEEVEKEIDSKYEQQTK